VHFEALSAGSRTVIPANAATRVRGEFQGRVIANRTCEPDACDIQNTVRTGSPTIEPDISTGARVCLMSLKTPDQPPVLGGLRRVAYVILGCLFVGLGVLGMMLPVLPTTPFLLVASYLFVRSSPRLNNWLLRSPVFGTFLRDWHQHRGVRPGVKVSAMAVMLAAVTTSITFGKLSWPVLVLLLSLAAVGLTVVLRLRVIRVMPSEESATCGGREQPAPGIVMEEVQP
jgi:uncharacterized membrane protein YbaN (DUF454 family)